MPHPLYILAGLTLAAVFITLIVRWTRSSLKSSARCASTTSPFALSSVASPAHRSESLFPSTDTHRSLGDEPIQLDHSVVEGHLDDLFRNARLFKSSDQYRHFIDFLAHFRRYSLFNGAMAYTQMPGATFIATAKDWGASYGRRIKPNARPIAILQPRGPIMWVFDVSDTEGAALPSGVHEPFDAQGNVDDRLACTIRHAELDRVRVLDARFGSQQAACIRRRISGPPLSSWSSGPLPFFYDISLSDRLSDAAKYASLVHELAHLYCGHLGTLEATLWPDRSSLDTQVEEFEAESVAFIVSRRAGVDTTSAEYLAGYLRSNSLIPNISLDTVFRAADRIEKLGTARPKRHLSGLLQQTANEQLRADANGDEFELELDTPDSSPLA